MSDALRLVAEELAAAGKPCITSSFQAECVVLVHMLHEIQPDIPVLFLDTSGSSGLISRAGPSWWRFAASAPRSPRWMGRGTSR